jgi:adenylosuccinate synthase
MEGDILQGKGVREPFSRLRVSEQALVITPFHQAANRIREIARGANRHGSCGVGVGEAVEDALLHPENCVLAGDLTNPVLLRQKLQVIRDLKREQVEPFHKDKSFEPLLIREWEFFERNDVIDEWIYSTARIGDLGLVVSDSVLEHWLHESNHVIFEGAQGVLLDADTGFHPYTTWSRCTTGNALDLIKEMAPDSQVCQIGVMRAYAVRHGPGPLPTETDSLTPVVSEHNGYNEWQGKVRYGGFDAVLARYALDITGGIDSLAVTHMDILSHLKTWKYCPGYLGYNDPDDKSDASMTAKGITTRFNLPPFLSLEQRTRYTLALSAVTPVIKECNADEDTVLREIESLMDQPPGIISRGPRAEDVQILNFPPS